MWKYLNEILDKLSPFFIEKTQSSALIKVADLYSLGISENKEIREYVCKQLNLGTCNNKQLLKRINLNRIELDKLKQIVDQFKNGN